MRVLFQQNTKSDNPHRSFNFGNCTEVDCTQLPNLRDTSRIASEYDNDKRTSSCIQDQAEAKPFWCGYMLKISGPASNSPAVNESKSNA